MKFIHYIIALGIAVLDLTTKAWILGNFDLYETHEVIPGIFSITLVQNTGVAFGLLQDVNSPLKPLLLSAIALMALIAIAYYGSQMEKEKSHPWPPAALGVVMGGILGNFMDRLYHESVVDFLDVYWRQHHWPTFNVADSAITVGIFTLLFDSFRTK